MTSFFFLFTLSGDTYCSSISIVDFEQVNAEWVLLIKET